MNQQRLEEYVDPETIQRVSLVQRVQRVSATEALKRIIPIGWMILQLEKQHTQLYIASTRRKWLKHRTIREPISFHEADLPETRLRTASIHVNINEQSKQVLSEMLSKFDRKYSLSDLLIWLVGVGTAAVLAEHQGSYVTWWNNELQCYERAVFCP